MKTESLLFSFRPNKTTAESLDREGHRIFNLNFLVCYPKGDFYAKTLIDALQTHMGEIQLALASCETPLETSHAIAAILRRDMKFTVVVVPLEYFERNQIRMIR